MSPLHCSSPKKDGIFQICVNYQRRNTFNISDTCPLSIMDNFIKELRNLKDMIAFDAL